MHSLIDYFSDPLGRIELLATLLAIVNVYLLARQQISNYLFGLGAVLLFGYLFLHSRLYSDMLLQWGFYAPLQVAGFLLWRYAPTLGESREPGALDSMRVAVLRPGGWLLTAALVLAGAAALGYGMASRTDASFPYADALTTTMSIAASLLMLRKILEHWVLWIAMDLIAVPIYFMKGLYVTSGLYVLFLALSVYGLLFWLRDYRSVRTLQVDRGA